MFNGIGIDFGASECRAAVWQDGRVRPLPEVVVPGEPVEVEIDRKRALRVDPFAPDGKRVPRWLRLETVKATLGTALSKDAETKATLRFRRLLANLAECLDANIFGASLAVPSYYGMNQRSALRAACIEAGFEDTALLGESVAAAMYTYRDHTAQGHLLAYCLGQSIFSVSVVALGNGTPSAVWHEGSTQLGGQDFEAMLVQHIVESLQTDGNVPLRFGRTALQHILPRAEQAKIALSRLDDETSAAEWDLEIGPPQLRTGGVLHRLFKVSSARLESLAAPLIEHTMALSRKAVDGAGLEPRDLAVILQVGKPARCSLVSRYLAETFPGVPIMAAQDHAVACGAAMHAASSHVCFTVPRTMRPAVVPPHDKSKVYDIVKSFGEVRVDAKMGVNLDACAAHFQEVQERARQQLMISHLRLPAKQAQAESDGDGPNSDQCGEHKEIQQALLRACSALAAAFCQVGRLREAKSLLQATAAQWGENLAIGEGLINIYVNLARDLCSKKPASQALFLLTAAVERWPDHEGLRLKLADICSQHARTLMGYGQLRDARVELEEACSQLEEGLRHRAESLDLLSRLAEVHVLLAQSYPPRQAGRGSPHLREPDETGETTWRPHLKKALAYAEKILQLDPGNEQARRWRSQLREVLSVPGTRRRQKKGARRR
jgi:tetratricopeptide (TPR) repeat protein